VPRTQPFDVTGRLARRLAEFVPLVASLIEGFPELVQILSPPLLFNGGGNQRIDTKHDAPPFSVPLDEPSAKAGASTGGLFIHLPQGA